MNTTNGTKLIGKTIDIKWDCGGQFASEYGVIVDYIGGEYHIAVYQNDINAVTSRDIIITLDRDEFTVRRGQK